MAVRMIVIMPHMVYWILSMAIQIINKTNINIYEQIYGSHFSDE